MNLGKRLQELRKENNYSQEDLAEKVGVTRQTISKWELDETSPDIKQSKKLAEIFKINLEDLFNNKSKNNTNVVNIIGLVFLDILFAIFMIFILAWIIVLISFVISTFTLSICMFFNINIYDVIPYIPYSCKVIMAISLLSLSVLSLNGTILFINLMRNIFNKYKVFHMNTLSNTNYSYEEKILKKHKIIKNISIISMMLFIVFLILSVIISIIISGNIEFWHTWNWFN